MDWKWKVPYKGGGQHFGCGNSNGIKSDFSKPAFSLLRRRTQIGPLKNFAKLLQHLECMSCVRRQAEQNNLVFSEQINYVQRHVRLVSINE